MLHRIARRRRALAARARAGARRAGRALGPEFARGAAHMAGQIVIGVAVLAVLAWLGVPVPAFLTP
ncbi:hypothetical protein [Streptomyces sp. NPDC001889]